MHALYTYSDILTLDLYSTFDECIYDECDIDVNALILVWNVGKKDFLIKFVLNLGFGIVISFLGKLIIS